MMIFRLIFIFCAAISAVECGCGELRLCCQGRNMSCIALDTTRPRSNALVPDGRVKAEGRQKAGPWHIHYAPGTKLDQLGESLNTGERFYESLFAPSSSLGDREGGGAKENVRSENVRLADEDNLLSTSSTTAADSIDGSAEGEYGSGEGEGETFASVDWLNSASKEEEKGNNDTEEVKIDSYKIVENDRYQVISADQKEFGDGEHLMIRYVIENDEVPVTIEQLEMLQNYRSLVGGEDRHCYCDEACRALGDCCGDYAAVCPVIDCLVTEWSGWSPCQASGHHQKYVPVESHQSHCGLGISRRERRIIREPMHGGKPCPVLEEQSACYTTDSPHCQQIRMQEVANVLPYEYGRARIPGYTNNSAGIFFDLPKDMAEIELGRTYCAKFEITWLNPACADDKGRQHLQPGRSVCVECQPAAQTVHGDHCVGEGATGQYSTWNLISNAKYCHGLWKQSQYVKRANGCKCEFEFPNDASFLFV